MADEWNQVPVKKEIKFKIINDDRIPAYAAFEADSANNGEAVIKVNIKASLLASADFDIDFYDLLAENTVHEMIHVFQELYRKTFDEDEVNYAILQARDFLGKSDVAR